ARRAAVGIADLGRNLSRLDEERALRPEPLAKNELACAAAVGVCGVEPAKADPPRMVEQLQGLFFTIAGTAQAGRRADSAEIAAAEPDPVDVALCQHLASSHAPRVGNLGRAGSGSIETLRPPAAAPTCRP